MNDVSYWFSLRHIVLNFFIFHLWYCRSALASNDFVTIAIEPLDQLKITNLVSDPSAGAISIFIGMYNTCSLGPSSVSVS